MLKIKCSLLTETVTKPKGGVTMNNKIKLQLNKVPELIRDLSKENMNLKNLCLSLGVLLFLSVIANVFLSQKNTQIVALDAFGSIAKVETKVTDLQVESAVKEYLNYRYGWDYKNIESELDKAKMFVHPSLVNSFSKSMISTIKYVKDQKVTQRVYTKSVEIDLKKKTVKLVADRITDFDGLKAVTDLKLVLNFEIDTRSVVNPWGVFVTKESEEMSK